MLDVIIALLPTTAAGIWFFGMPAVWTIAVCVSTCLAVEAMCRLAMKREGTIGDFSAVLTGLLLALNLPAGLPLWMAALGSVFAITVCKQVFGGLGKNPFNPALAARAFLLISFTGPMTTWLKPYWWKTPDAVTTATPLASMKPMFDAAATTTATPHAGSDGIPALWDLVTGNMPGCIGEVSAVLLIAGGVYLTEAVSVILQVGSFKLRHKRIFKMAPIHHHFEKCGWSEVKIVGVFTLVTVISCVLAYFGV